MRQAEIERMWKRLYARSGTSKLERVTFDNVLGLGSGTIEFSGPLTAICGGNGVGKTTLLDTIRAALNPSTPPDPLASKVRFAGCKLGARFATRDKASELAVSFAPDGQVSTEDEIIGVHWIDPGFLGAKLKRLFSEMQNLEELLEALSPRELPDKERQILSYMVGKDYDACLIYEIEDYNNEPTIPYFRVTAGGVTYGSEMMGLGEMSLHLLYWYLETVTQDAVILIEEPETHISPRSQSALLDILVKFSLEKQLCTILTTHSPAIVCKIPNEHVRLLFRHLGAVNIISNPSDSALHTSVGIEQRRAGVLLVEDRTAKAFLSAWLEHYDHTILQVYEIIDVGSEGQIVAALKGLPKFSDIRIIGVFDGDMRAKDATYNFPHAFLPGDTAPEQLLRSTANSRAAALAERAHCTLEHMLLNLAELAGQDHHDWLVQLSKSLNKSQEWLLSELVALWLESEENQQTSIDAYRALTNILSAIE